MDITPDYNAAPRNFFFQLPKYHDGIERCFECATSCWISADAFIGERDSATLHRAIEATLHCAEVCARTVKVMVAYERYAEKELAAHLKECIDACSLCIKETQGHCHEHEHCLICVKSCEECLRVCESYFNDLV